MNRDEWVSMAEYLVWEYALHYAQFRYESSEAGPVDKAFRALTSHLRTVPVERPSPDARDAVVAAADKALDALLVSTTPLPEDRAKVIKAIGLLRSALRALDTKERS